MIGGLTIATILAATMQTIQAPRHFLEPPRARTAGSYVVDAATYLAIVTGEMAGVGLD